MQAYEYFSMIGSWSKKTDYIRENGYFSDDYV